MNAQAAPPELRERDEAVIRRELGRHDGRGITFVDEGWDSRVYIVNGGQAVFKFPRAPEVSTQYRHEIAALQMLEGMTTGVRTPQVRWIAPDLEYFGYVGIVGEPLSTVVGDLGPGHRTRMGVAIGRFLSALHCATLEAIPTTTVDDEMSNYLEKYRLARSTLTATFSAEEMRVVEEFFVELLPVALPRLGSDLALSHGDLGPWNMILTPGGDVAVIDFGDVGYHDASKDFSGFGDEVILRAALDEYGADEVLREKARLRMKALPVLDMPFYLAKQNHAGVRSCLELVRRVIIGG